MDSQSRTCMGASNTMNKNIFCFFPRKLYAHIYFRFEKRFSAHWVQRWICGECFLAFDFFWKSPLRRCGFARDVGRRLGTINTPLRKAGIVFDRSEEVGDWQLRTFAAVRAALASPCRTAPQYQTLQWRASLPFRLATAKHSKLSIYIISLS